MRTLICFLLLPLFVGCGASGPTTFQRTGQVTYNAEPIAKGRIDFMPVGGKGTAYGAEITDGTYKVALRSGEYQVLVTATRATGTEKIHPEDPNSEEQEVFEQYIPKKYNVDTTLRSKVTGREEQDFELTETNS